MKKKFLFTMLMSALFVLVLALGISASTVYKDADGNELFRFETDENSIITTYEGEFPKTDSEGNALTWYVTATATEGEDTVKTVVSFKTLDEAYATLDANGIYSYKNGTGATTKTVVAANFPYDMGIKKLNLAGGGYKNNIHYDPNGTEILFVYLPNTLMELPERIVQGTKALVCHIPMEAQIQRISHVAFYEAKCLREVNIPATVTEIAGQGAQNGSAFYCCDSLEIVHIGENSQLVTIGSYVFHKNYKLREFKIPDSVTTIGTHAFSYTALVESPFGEGSRCETLGGRAFSDITTLKSFVVPATLTSVSILGSNDYGPISDCVVELVTFGNAAPITELLPSFFGRATIEKIILPNGPTSIPPRYFVNAKLTDVCMSDTIKTIAEFAFESATVEVIRLGANFEYFTNDSGVNQRMTNAVKGLKAIYIPASFYAEKPETIYQVAYALNAGGSNSVDFFYTGTLSQLEAAIINFKEGTTEATLGNSAFLNATLVSYEEYALDPDAYDAGNYLVYGYNRCDAFCEPFYNDDMERTEAIVYENYLEKGVLAGLCPICSSPLQGEEVPALFTSMGVSAKTFGDGIGLVQGYYVNMAAIEAYRVYAPDFNFGVLAYANILGTECAPKPGDDKVVDVIFDNAANSYIEVKVTGIPADFLNTPIVFCIYAIDGGKLYYLDNGTTSETVVGTSYESMDK